LAGGIECGSINEETRVITLLGIPYCDALYFMRDVKILGLRATRSEALHEDMK
jgi:hypothetical protein